MLTVEFFQPVNSIYRQHLDVKFKKAEWKIGTGKKENVLIVYQLIFKEF